MAVQKAESEEMYVLQMVQINENNKSDHWPWINHKPHPLNEVEVETDANDEEHFQIESSKDIENI